MNPEMRFFKEPSSEPDDGTSVKMEKGAKLGEGAFGSVYEATVEIGGRKRNFVIKEFKDGEDASEGTAEERAQHALRNWQEARKAGLKVFTTYRLGEDGKSVLMTAANDKDTICVDPFPDDGATIEALGREPLHEIADLDGLIARMTAECEKAAGLGIAIFPDSYFMLVDRATDDVDFVLGDTDNIEPTQEPEEKCRSMNLTRAGLVLEAFVRNNVSGEKREDYLERVRGAFDRRS